MRLYIKNFFELFQVSTSFAVFREQNGLVQLEVVFFSIKFQPENFFLLLMVILNFRYFRNSCFCILNFVITLLVPIEFRAFKPGMPDLPRWLRLAQRSGGNVAGVAYLYGTPEVDDGPVNVTVRTLKFEMCNETNLK